MLYTTNFIEWNQRERWKLGTMQGLRVTEQGWLMLEEGASEGIYTTQEVETIPSRIWWHAGMRTHQKEAG